MDQVRVAHVASHSTVFVRSLAILNRVVSLDLFNPHPRYRAPSAQQLLLLKTFTEP
jgi:hypothetical protein